jgi:hypothetical protein
LAQSEGAEAEVITRPHITEVPIFVCPGCGSIYKVARLKTPPEPQDHPVGCLTCERALAPREDEFLLKYIRIERPTNDGGTASRKANKK